MVAIETILLENNISHRGCLEDYPLIKALNERVRNSPKIESYLEKRGPPVYNFS